MILCSGKAKAQEDLVQSEEDLFFIFIKIPLYIRSHLSNISFYEFNPIWNMKYIKN